jgi:hypothetical protein
MAGPKGYRRSDERILDELCERLARSGVDVSDVEVRVEDGGVTLRGWARTRDDRRSIEGIAERVVGVEDVDARLAVGAPPEDTAGAGTGTGGTGLTMSARQAGASAPAQEPPPAGRR